MTTATTIIERVVSWLTKEGVDAIAVFDPAFNSFIETNAVFSLSGARSSEASAVVVDRSGRSCLVVTDIWNRTVMVRQSRTDITIAEKSLRAGLMTAIEQLGLANCTFASDGLARLGRATHSDVSSVLGEGVTNADGIVAHLGRIKSAEEVARASTAHRIAEESYRHMLKVLRPGMREYELAAEVYDFALRQGADDNFLLLSASRHNKAVQPPGDRILLDGDVVLAEISPSVGGQFAQICRTVVLGAPSAAIQSGYALLQDAMRRGLDHARPGVRVGDIVAAVDAAFEAVGLEAYCRPPYMRVRGHGLGLASFSPGDLTRDNSMHLEEGMLFVLHPNQYLPDVGYLMFGDTLLIEQQGARSFSEKFEPLGVAHWG